MKTLSMLTAVAATILCLGGVANADGHYVRRPGYQQYHYAPRSYRTQNRAVYRRGYPGPSYGYYGYGSPHYNRRVVYFNFFGLPVVSY
jgi:hypothetical protein